MNFCDHKFLSYAINLSRKNAGLTAPNPVVGCIIVKNNEILASGVTAAGGRPHAEIIAIDNAIKKFGSAEILAGTTFYVTVEPCSHLGKTPPCVDEIIKHRVAKVVIGTIDPDSRVNGKGIEKLRQAGIEVIYDESLKHEVEKINRGFFKSRRQQIPFVTLKLATSLDGKIATKNFDSKWITSETARQFAHKLRSTHDAILVGANTIRKDDPSLDCRIAGLEEFSPKRVVISRDLDFDLNAKIFQNAKEIPTFIITSDVTSSKAEALQNLGVELIFVGARRAVPVRNLELHGHGTPCPYEGGMDLKEALKKLSENEINSVLVEGGANIATQILQQKLFDELVWIRADKVIGNDGIAAIGALEIEKIAELLQLQKTSLIELDSDLVTIYKAR